MADQGGNNDDRGDREDHLGGGSVLFDTAVDLQRHVQRLRIGKLIGRQGRTVAALRTLASTAGEKEGKTVTLEIRDTPFRG